MIKYEHAKEKEGMEESVSRLHEYPKLSMDLSQNSLNTNHDYTLTRWWICHRVRLKTTLGMAKTKTIGSSRYLIHPWWNKDQEW